MPAASDAVVTQILLIVGLGKIWMEMSTADRAEVKRLAQRVIARYGMRELSSNIIRRLDEATELSILTPGVPSKLTNDEPEEPGHEVAAHGKAVPDI